MSLYIDKKYVSLVSTKLERFKQKSEFLWNFRCPICNDSAKNKLKARGYFYRRKSDICFQCHNCGTSMALGNFLKITDKSLYREYQLERYKDENSGNVKQPDFALARTKPVFNTEPKINLPSIASLNDTHYAKEYLLERKIPRERMGDIYYAASYKDFVQEILPHYDKKLYNEPRIVLPYYDQAKHLLGFQGRALGETKVKYITIKMDDDNYKLYGLDKVDVSKKIYVVEGPIDSLFIRNAVATMDANLHSVIPVLGDQDYTFIYDNEPRNTDIVKQMAKTITQNKNIFIWPQDIVAKDINDWIVTGATPSEIQSIIDKHTFNDLKARLEFDRWKKV